MSKGTCFKIIHETVSMRFQSPLYIEIFKIKLFRNATTRTKNKIVHQLYSQKWKENAKWSDYLKKDWMLISFQLTQRFSSES